MKNETSEKETIICLFKISRQKPANDMPTKLILDKKMSTLSDLKQKITDNFQLATKVCLRSVQISSTLTLRIE